jgi:hypothetical protein
MDNYIDLNAVISIMDIHEENKFKDKQLIDDFILAVANAESYRQACKNVEKVLLEKKYIYNDE